MAHENLPGDDRIVVTGATGLGMSVPSWRRSTARSSRATRASSGSRRSLFLERAPRFHGAWSHYYNDETGETMPLFGMYDNGGDIIETSYVIQGLLTARGYFDRNETRERSLRERVTALWEAVEWDWFRMSPDSPFLYWYSLTQRDSRSRPADRIQRDGADVSLAIASPTHPVPASLYYSGWASQAKNAQDDPQGWSGSPDGRLYANGNTYFGIKLDVVCRYCSPFFIHYIFMGFDPRQLRDRYTDSYFEVLSNRPEINCAGRHCRSEGVEGLWRETPGIYGGLRI